MLHIAGPWVTPDDDLVIQRCFICGYSLINQRVSRMAVPDGTDREISTWKYGDLVDVIGENPTICTLVKNMIDHPDVMLRDIKGLCIHQFT